MKVFLSSTYLDLIEHRKAVIQALRTMGEEVDHMEIFGARNEEPKKASLEQLDECQILVGIYAYRYGTVPKGSKTSVTEQEYLYATSKKIPILVFVVNEDQDWPPKKMDETLTKIKRFKAKASSEHTPAYFTTADNLATQVVAAVGKHAKRLKAKKRKKPSAKSSSRRETLPKDVAKGIRDGVRGSTLPNQPYFFGREKELQTIADAISPESRTWGALIDGPGGIGKTALSIKAAHDAPEKLFERKIFISAKVRELTPEGEKPLKDFSRDNYFSMLNELALELGEEGIPRLAPDERANQLRIAMAGKKSLIVFDNLETLSEDERTRLFQFLSRLPEGNKAIVTSRRRADVDARVIRLDRLSADEALALISELAKNNPRLAREDEKARHDLYEITNGNPLLIKWVCGQLGRDGSALHTISEACKFIENAPEGNDPLEYIFGDLLETFTESETKVLAALTHFAQPTKLKWIVDMTGLTKQATETALEDLTDRSVLITSIEAREFFLPPLASHFMRTRRPQIINETGDRMADKAYEIILENKMNSITETLVLETEWIYIASALPFYADRKNELLQNICDYLYAFLETTGRWDLAIYLNEIAEERALSDDDTLNGGLRATMAGWIYSLRGQTKEALACADRAEKYWQDGTVILNHIIRLIRAHAYVIENDYKTALKLYQQSVDEINVAYPKSDVLAEVLDSLAGVEIHLGNNDSGERNLKEALRIAKKSNNLRGIVLSTGNLAILNLKLEKWEKAETLARKALKLAEKLGNQRYIANNKLSIARILEKRGHPNEALFYARDSVDIYTRLHALDLKSAQEVVIKIQKSIEIQSAKK